MIKISTKEIEFMIRVLPLSDYFRNELIKLLSESNKCISDDFADKLRDLCAERLDTHGFDVNYSPTEEGVILEKLIDKLFIG